MENKRVNEGFALGISRVLCHPEERSEKHLLDFIATKEMLRSAQHDKLRIRR